MGLSAILAIGWSRFLASGDSLVEAPGPATPRSSLQCKDKRVSSVSPPSPPRFVSWGSSLCHSLFLGLDLKGSSGI